MFWTPVPFYRSINTHILYVIQETGRIRVAEAPQGYADVPQRIASPGPLSPSLRKSGFFGAAGPISPGGTGRKTHFSPSPQRTTFAGVPGQVKEPKPVPPPILTGAGPLNDGSTSEGKISDGESGHDLPQLDR